MKVIYTLGDYYQTHDAIERDPRAVVEKFAEIMRKALASDVPTITFEPSLHAMRSWHGVK